MNAITIKALPALVSLASALFAGPAVASIAESSVTNLTFTLVDLDPNDGIEPSFQVLSGKGSGRATYMWGDDSKGYRPPLLRSATPFASFTSDAGFGSTYRATGANFAISRAEGLFSVLRGPTWSPSAWACNECRLILSANTRLIVSGDYALAAQDNGNPRPHGYDLDGRATANVLVHLANGRTVFGDVNESLSTVTDSFAESLSRSGSFSFDVTNDRDRLRGDYFLSVSAHSSAFGTALPEPSTYAMMLGGLAMIGLVAHRRRRGAKDAGGEAPRR